MTDRVLRPFFPYLGSKWRLAPAYPKPLGSLLVEPFAGSAGYALRRAAGRPVLLLDRNPVVVAIWEYLLRVHASEVLRLPVDVASVDDLSTSLPEEARYLIRFWFSRARAQPAFRLSAWGRMKRWPGSFWGERVRFRIASQLVAIRGWRVRCADYREAPDGPDVTMFVDPPYLGEEGDHYRKFRHLDHAELGCWCRSRMGQVIVCGGTSDSWLPFHLLRNARTTRGESEEFIWEKGASL